MEKYVTESYQSKDSILNNKTVNYYFFLFFSQFDNIKLKQKV